MARKILITYASSGAGHRRAAEALLEALMRRYDGTFEVELIDALDFTKPFFRRTYPATYLVLIRYLPWLWGWLFHLVDWPGIRELVRLGRRITNRINARGLEQFIRTLNPDVVLSTHFFPDEVLTELKRRGLWRGTHLTCVTDFGVHGFWVQPLVDRYIVGSPEARRALIERGIPPDHVDVLGIPINPAFGEPVGRERVMRQLGMDLVRWTIVVLSGGFGVGPIEAIAQALQTLDVGTVQGMIVCGNHPRLERKLKAWAERAHVPVLVLGFVTNMDELLAVADLVITKSGGLTVSEALARQVPLVIIDPIPGQEQVNCEVVVRQGAGILVHGIDHLRQTLIDLLSHSDKLHQMKVACSMLGKPHAADAVADLALRSLGTVPSQGLTT